MRTPLRPLPEPVSRWITRVRYLRWLDAGAAWLAVWATIAITGPDASVRAQAVAAAISTGLAALVPFVRVRWRPVSAVVCVSVSRGLQGGDRAWYVRPDHARPVLIAARRWWHVVIVGPGDEGLRVRRSRVLLVPEKAVEGAGTMRQPR